MTDPRGIRSEFTFGKGPSAMLRDADLSERARLLYVILDDHTTGNDRESWPSRNRLAGLIGCSRSSIDRALRELQDGGWIEIDPRYDDDGRQTTSIIVLSCSPGASPVTRGRVSPVTYTGVSPVTHKAEPEEAEPEGSIEVLLATDAPVSQSAPGAAFDEFWLVYPRRVGKRTARKAFEAAIRRADVDVILAGATRYATDPNRADEFTAHPSTWLNRDGWDDEPLPQRTSHATRTDKVVNAIALGDRMQAAFDGDSGDYPRQVTA